MIFITAKDRPDMFVMLAEKDIQTMREGRTLFVDERATEGLRGDHVGIHPLRGLLYRVLGNTREETRTGIQLRDHH